MTHLYLIHPTDRPRFAELNVVADFQIAPSSVTRSYEQAMEGLIGKQVNNLMPLRSMTKAGALITLSSDWDADELSPLVKLKTVLSRQQEGAPDLATAIEMLTINPARLLRHDDKTGSIEVGKYADLVILDRDLFEVDIAELDKVQVLATLLQGKPVYDSQGLFDD
ncbi:MAG: amidohydrolase family protein [Pseudomonadota bacterium]